MNMAGEGKVREAVGVFADVSELNEAVAELETTAFSREAISVLGSRKVLQQTLGVPEAALQSVEDDPDAPRKAPVHPEEKAVGTGAMIGGGAYVGAVAALLLAGEAIVIPAIITAAALGGGSGAFVSKILGRHFHDSVEKQIEKGGLVLWVETHGEEDEKLACDILARHGAKDVHIHEIA